MATPQSEQKKEAGSPFNIDIRNIGPMIGNLYNQYGWILKIIGIRLPKEAEMGLTILGKGANMTKEEAEQLQQQFSEMGPGMQPGVGEPVMTMQLAEEAYMLHKQGMGTREIADLFTKEGSPCSHATVARWINMVDQEKRFGRIALLIRFGKIAGLVSAFVLAVLIGHWVF
jgi:hypothetical protein